MNTPKLLKMMVVSAMMGAPMALLAQTPTPLVQFQFNEGSSPSSLTNMGSIVATATYTGTLSSQAGVSQLSSDYCFDNSGATGMGTLGTVGGVYMNTSAVGTALKSMTLQGWFKSGTVIGNGARLMDNYNTTSVSGFTLRGASSSETTQGALYLLIDGQTLNSPANSYSDTNSWVFFAVTYDSVSKAVKFYKGTTASAVVQVGSTQTFGIDVGLVDASTTTFCMGNLSSSIRPYDGYLENMRVYGVTGSSAGALTLAQLETLRRADMVNAKAIAAVTVTASSVIRSDITRTTFGSGVEHNNKVFRDAMTGTGTNSATRLMMQDMGLGTFRFPNGTSAQFYRWDNPAGSFLNGAPNGTWILTPDEIYTYTGASVLNMERLFQVNTYRYWSGGVEQFINQNGQSSPWVISTSKLDGAATTAAAWVTNNLQKPSVTYWEVGNEDWIYWGPTAYAQIFSAYATKMKAANPNIKLLAQTITNTYSGVGGINTPAWTSSFAGALSSTVSGYVYALSEHEYMNGYANTGAKDFSDRTSSVEMQRNLQTQNMFAKIERNDRLAYLKSELTRLGLNWKIWMTEYNVMQYNVNGTQMLMQDLGHAMAVADFTGRILQSGVERLSFHALDHNHYFSLIDYQNVGGTISAPIKTAPGYAYEVFTQDFGPEMVRNVTVNNPTLSSPNEGTYGQVSVYSSVRDSDNTLRLVVINRSPSNGIQITVQCSGRTMAAAPAQYQRQELYSANLTDHNMYNPDHVKWSTPVSATSSSTLVEGIVLREHSVNLIVIPLQ